MLRWIHTAVAVALLVATGIVQGMWSDRWAVDEQTTAAAKMLDEIPMVIGDWEGTEIKVKPGTAGAGVTGCIQRNYTNRKIGATVVIALVNGRPGPVSTHTPEACYGASGYTVGKREAVPITTAAETDRFWTADATRVRATEETKLRIFWGWNAGEGWVASNDGRSQFPLFRYPILHKLYVLREITGTNATTSREAKDEPCVAFLNELVPALNASVFKAGN